MIDLFSQLDHTFVLYFFSIAINVLTQLGKPFHKEPLQVFTFIAFVVCVVYGILALFVTREAIVNVVTQMSQILLLASGAWHVLMRPESPIRTLFNKQK